MSLLSTAREPSDADRQPRESNSVTRQRRPRRAAQPGHSILAHGEPLVWLTGGALVICLAMVVGLLVLVVVAGMSTFWPVGVVRVALKDGTVHMGEVTRREVFELSEAMVDGMPEAIAAAARKELDGDDSTTARRRLFRTGNFELTSSHFHWVSDFEVADESLPPWAVVMERIEWGRFYGQPQSFALRHPRTPDERETKLKSTLDFFQTHRWRLPAERQTLLDEKLAPLQSAYQQQRQANVTAFLEKFSASKADSVQAVVSEQADPLPLTEAASGDVTEVRELWTGPDAAWQQFEQYHAAVRHRFRRRRALEEFDLGRVDRRLEDRRLAVREAELRSDVAALPVARELEQLATTLREIEEQRQAASREIEALAGMPLANAELVALGRQIGRLVAEELEQQSMAPRERGGELRSRLREFPPEAGGAVEAYLETLEQAHRERAVVLEQIDALDRENQRYELRMITSRERPKVLALNEIVRAYPANQLSLTDKLAVYGSRWLEFLTDDPREANSEGGVFPAIWGTVVMTLIMSIVVVPFGVLAALYLREYARSGLVVSAVRIAINNLAGVPSIVFGVFGLGFFCYMVGGFVDSGPAGAGITPWPPASWFVLLLLVALAAAGGFFLSLWSMARHGRPNPWQRWAGRLAMLLWLLATAAFAVLIAVNPYFEGFFRAGLPNPTFGKGGLLWASLTLALLTLPVVIVATEEALAAVPNSLREGSYAAGAGKWQTIRRIVLPHAAPGIMTGMILAMARGAGEVAPLMLVGAVKLAPELPIDTVAPFLHAQRSFMHLGFHIYDLGFQSQNSEAAKPMVFTTTLLLILLIALLNLSAIALRARLRRRFQSSHF